MKTTELVIEFLNKNGFFHEINEKNGNVDFRFEMKNFVLVNTNDDDTYFQLVMPEIYQVTEENREMAMEAANKTNIGTKIAKACVFNDGVYLFFESVLDKTPEMDIVLPRALRSLQYAAQLFYKELN